MAKAKRKRIPFGPNWRAFEDIFQRMRARLRSSKAAVDEFNALLRSGEWPSAWRQVNSEGKEIRRGFAPKDFWRGPTSPYDVRNTLLSVKPDDDGVGDCLITPNYTEFSEYDASLAFHGVVTEFYGRLGDCERWERARPLPTPPPPAVAPDQQPEEKVSPDSSKLPSSQRRPTKASELADAGRTGPGRPSPKPLVADEIDRLTKSANVEDSNILKGKKTKLWEHLASVCRNSGFNIDPKSIGSLIRRNKMLPT
jgi:hypothetical protein